MIQFIWTILHNYIEIIYRYLDIHRYYTQSHIFGMLLFYAFKSFRIIIIYCSVWGPNGRWTNTHQPWTRQLFDLKLHFSNYDYLVFILTSCLQLFSYFNYYNVPYILNLLYKIYLYGYRYIIYIYTIYCLYYNIIYILYMYTLYLIYFIYIYNML